MGGSWNQDITGLKIGRATAISFSHKDRFGKSIWNLSCECGGSAMGAVSSLKRGNVKSCGCLQKQRASEANKTHGMTRQSEHSTWSGIKSRCYNHNQKAYQDYGGRGIKMCDKWLNSFEAFLEDMGPKPAPNFTIEREDPNGDYCPDNCVWLERSKQNFNKRVSRLLTANGKTMICEEWARSLGISSGAISNFLKRNPGKSFQEYVDIRIKPLDIS